MAATWPRSSRRSTGTRAPPSTSTRFHERVARRTGRTGSTSSSASCSRPYLLGFFRARAIDSEKVPADGPAILAPNHFSFLDHFFVAVYLRRKVHFMAKSQLFKRRWAVLSHHGGVFPVRRGHRDEEAFKTAHAILERGDIDRDVRRGRPLAHRRAGRAASPASAGSRSRPGVPVVPVAIAGTERVRNWKRRPVPEGHRAVRRARPLRAGRASPRASRRRRSRSRSSSGSA